jgi:ubiquinone/menaquinone biosynthesis C-methylase UbiE
MSRLDENDDLDYFAVPDIQPYWPLEESRYVSNTYDRELEPGDRVLDLMAGTHSPLQESSIKLAHLSCAGLNRQELQLNPICAHLVNLNVNTIEKLPYATNSFDAILLHAAIEYITNPKKVFAEIRRVLKTGGKIIISSNQRTEQQKAIRLWRDTMDFEHLAIVAYYLRQFARCDQIIAESHRHITSQQDDPAGSEHPIFIVCGQLRT